LTAVN